jgi:hypothetical protein
MDLGSGKEANGRRLRIGKLDGVVGAGGLLGCEMTGDLAPGSQNMAHKELLNIASVGLVQTDMGLLQDSVGGCAASCFPFLGHKCLLHST